MKKMFSLSIKNRLGKNFNIKKSKKKNQSKLLTSQKLKCNKNKSKQYTKKKKIQRGNAAQLIDNTQTSFLSIIQSNNNLNNKIKIKILDEQSCLKHIKFGFNYLKDFLTKKVSEELDKIINTLFENYQIIKNYCEEKIEILQDEIKESNMVKIMSLAIIIGNLVLFFLDHKEKNITLEDTQLPSKILFIFQTLVNIYLLSTDSTSRNEFLKKINIILDLVI